MRTTLRLLASSVAVSAAIGALAVSAQATEPMENYYEPSLAHCTLSICTGTLSGEATLRTHFFGVEATEAACHIEVDESVGESDTATIDAVTMTNGGHGETNCSTVMPACGGTLPWSAGLEETGVNIGELDVSDTCFDPGEFATCEGPIDYIFLEETGANNVETRHDISGDTRIGNSFCEMDFAGWESNPAANPRFHTRHLTDPGTHNPPHP